jgi:hypothetical protein
MNDPLKKDDDKFNDLIVKQHSTVDGFLDSVSPKKNNIEKDDEKFEKLSMSQEISSTREIHNPEYNSIEEKYEVELLSEQFFKKIDEKLNEADVDIFDLLDEFEKNK